MNPTLSPSVWSIKTRQSHLIGCCHIYRLVFLGSWPCLIQSAMTVGGRASRGTTRHMFKEPPVTASLSRGLGRDSVKRILREQAVDRPASSLEAWIGFVWEAKTGGVQEKGENIPVGKQKAKSQRQHGSGQASALHYAITARPEEKSGIWEIPENQDDLSNGKYWSLVKGESLIQKLVGLCLGKLKNRMH